MSYSIDDKSTVANYGCIFPSRNQKLLIVVHAKSNVVYLRYMQY